jgi:hypothetical protein
MNRAILERYTVVVLFVLVLVAFSFAERDSKKMDLKYAPAVSYKPLQKKAPVAVSGSGKATNTTYRY